MINLDIQFKLIIFSFIFGFFFSYFLEWFNRNTINLKKYLRITLSFITMIILTIIYFFGIQKIGYAVFHVYEILCIILGFVSYDFIIKLIAK